jgi:hypothetical protein
MPCRTAWLIAVHTERLLGPPSDMFTTRMFRLLPLVVNQFKAATMELTDPLPSLLKTWRMYSLVPGCVPMTP